MTTVRGQRSTSIPQLDKRRPGESDPPTTRATVGGGKADIRTLGPRPSPTPCSPRCPTQGVRHRPGRRRAHAGQSSHGSSLVLSLTGRPGLALALQAQTPSRGRTLITAVATGYRLLDDGHTSFQQGARPTVSPQRTALCLSVSLTGPPGCSVMVLGHLSRCQGHPGFLLCLLSPSQGTRMSPVENVTQTQGSGSVFTHLFNPRGHPAFLRLREVK